MPPKTKRGAAAQKSKAGEEEREEPLQAVILADSFETRFNPFTIERPRCLLPLANTPLIEYTLEFLAGAGVEEIYLYSGNHTDQVEEYLQRSKWTKDTSPFSLEIIRSTSRSIGDAMRDLDQKGLISRDFICVYGDVVANLALEGALAAHRARRAKDKNAVMTMVLREAGEAHRTKSQHMRPCFVIDPARERCVHYEQVYPREAPRLDLSDEVLTENVELEIREDLIDCGVDICTPEVLAQWSDNFDWQMPRRGFLYGVLKDYETNRLTIHTHVLAEGYAARVRNLKAYEAITKDVVGRWTYPLCPDTNMLEGQSYQLGKGHVYKEDGVVLARSSVMGRKTVVGRNTAIGAGSVITNSIIGRRCIIGKNVTISDSYIWDDAHVGDGSVVQHAIVANEASVGKNCTVRPGALISYAVSVANHTTIPPNTRITRYQRRHDPDDPLTPGPTDPQLVGEHGQGFAIPLDADADDDDDDEEPLENLLTADGDRPSTPASTSDPDSDSDLEPSDLLPHTTTSTTTIHPRTESFTSTFSTDAATDDFSTPSRTSAALADFHHEAVTGMYDALLKSEAPETVQLELRALTLSSNAAGKSVRRAVAAAFAKHLLTGTIGAGGHDEPLLAPKDAVAKTLRPYHLVVRGCVAAKDVEEQREFLLALQLELATGTGATGTEGQKVVEKIWVFALMELVTSDLVLAEGVERWWEDERSFGKGGNATAVEGEAMTMMGKLRESARQLVETLVGDSDEDDEEEEEEEDSRGPEHSLFRTVPVLCTRSPRESPSLNHVLSLSHLSIPYPWNAATAAP
nr:translation initiation factor eif-2b subunit epsilon [Quercus suber]